MSFTKFHCCIVAIVAVTVYKLVAKSVFAENMNQKIKIKYKTFPKSGPHRHTMIMCTKSVNVFACVYNVLCRLFAVQHSSDSPNAFDTLECEQLL